MNISFLDNISLRKSYCVLLLLLLLLHLAIHLHTDEQMVEMAKALKRQQRKV